MADSLPIGAIHRFAMFHVEHLRSSVAKWGGEGKKRVDRATIINILLD